MDAGRRSAKWKLIVSWIVSVIAIVITTPIAFIAGAFATDSGTSAALTIGLLVMFSPIIFLILAIIAQVLYVKAHYRGAGMLALGTTIIEVLAVGGLAYVISGMSFS